MAFGDRPDRSDEILAAIEGLRRDIRALTVELIDAKISLESVKNRMNAGARGALRDD